MARQKSNNISTLYEKLGFGDEYPERQKQMLRATINDFWSKLCNEKSNSAVSSLSAEDADAFASRFCRESQRGETFWPVPYGGASWPAWETEKEQYVVKSSLLKHTQLTVSKYIILFGQNLRNKRKKPTKATEK